MRKYSIESRRISYNAVCDSSEGENKKKITFRSIHPYVTTERARRVCTSEDSDEEKTLTSRSIRCDPRASKQSLRWTRPNSTIPDNDHVNPLVFARRQNTHIGSDVRIIIFSNLFLLGMARSAGLWRNCFSVFEI